jgi:hypothetical protein
LYRQLHGDGAPPESEYKGFHPEYNSLAIPSLSTMGTIVSVARLYGEDESVMLPRIRQIAMELKRRGDRYCILKFDAIFLKKKIQFDSKKGEMVGMAEGKVKIDDWNEMFRLHGVDVFEEISQKHFINQCYTFIISSLDNKMTSPYHYYPLYNDVYSDIVEVIRNTYEVLWGYGIKLKIVSADGGSSCRKALRQLVEDTELAHMKLIPFSDCDHLFKTLRNKLAKNHVKCNERTLNWDLIRKVWKEDVGLQGVLPVSCLDPAKDKQRSDWMRWVCHEPVVVQHLRDAAANRGDGQKDEATDLFYLAEFLHNTNKYIEAWDGKEKTDLDRFTDIYKSSQFFFGCNKDFIISGLTDKARAGIMLNLASWGELAK